MKEEILKKLLDYLQNTVVFAQEQLPDLLQQIVFFEKIKLFWFLFIEIVVLIGAYLLFRYFIKLLNIDGKKGVYRTDKQETLMFISGWVSIGAGIIFIVCLLTDLTNLFQIYYAPKVFLIEYIKTIL